MPFRSPKRWATACSRRVDRLGAALAIGAALLASDVAAQGRSYVSGFVGEMTDNEWGEVFTEAGNIKWRNAQQLGGGVSREWPVWSLGFIGVEAHALKHFGEQTHVEFTVPLFLRTPRPRSVFLPSLAYGLGLSYGTEPSKTEIARTGESTELLAHWFFEAEFGNDDSRVRPWLRLHHRSHAWETFDARTGSNAVLVGIRVPLETLTR